MFDRSWSETVAGMGTIPAPHPPNSEPYIPAHPGRDFTIVPIATCVNPDFSVAGYTTREPSAPYPQGTRSL